MNLFIKIIMGFTLLSTSVYGDWREIDQPFEGVKVEIKNDKNSNFAGVDILYARFTISDKWLLTQFIVDCKNEHYVMTYRQSEDDKFANLNISNIVLFDENTILFYPLNEYCDNQPTSWGICYPEDSEDLDRTPQAEMLNILTKEMEI